MEWVAISFSRRSPNPGIEPRSPALYVDALPSDPPEKSSSEKDKAEERYRSNETKSHKKERQESLE